MSLDEARKILGNLIDQDEHLTGIGDDNFFGEFVHWTSGTATLDGEFTADQLEAIAVWMRAKTSAPLRLASSATILSFVSQARYLLLRLIGQLQEKDEAAMIWKKDTDKNVDQDPGTENLSFEGNGKVSVSVASIVNSERVQQQVKAVREIQAIQEAAKNS